jgi:hypothetical protein
MTKDRRYKAVKGLLESGNIKTFDDLLDVIPVTVLRKDIGLNHKSISMRFMNSETFVMKDLLKLAELIECDPLLVVKLTLAEIERQKKTRK